MPLSALDIKLEIMRRGDSIAGLARKWNTTPEILGRVIHRRWFFVYPEVRKRLARYLNVPVREVGQDPKRKRQAKRTEGKAA